MGTGRSTGHFPFTNTNCCEISYNYKLHHSEAHRTCNQRFCHPQLTNLLLLESTCLGHANHTRRLWCDDPAGSYGECRLHGCLALHRDGKRSRSTGSLGWAKTAGGNTMNIWTNLSIRDAKLWETAENILALNLFKPFALSCLITFHHPKALPKCAEEKKIKKQYSTLHRKGLSG